MSGKYWRTVGTLNDGTSPVAMSKCWPESRLLDGRVVSPELGLAAQTAALSPLLQVHPNEQRSFSGHLL